MATERGKTPADRENPVMSAQKITQTPGLERIRRARARARAALTALVEPGDEQAHRLVRELGPERALEEMTAEGSRWAGRARGLDPDRDLETMAALGGGLLIPEDEAWPAALDRLGAAAPLGLWFRGAGMIPQRGKALAVVGSLASTAYGTTVTSQIAGHAARAGVCVVSDGPYGVAGAAHRGALDAGDDLPGFTATVAVLAGGLDQFYTFGHKELLDQIAETGLLLSEMPPGTPPTRSRFLHRNRLIAALSGAVVVTESSYRSGAQNVAAHALALGSRVGAVPGPVTSASSAGCHRLLKESHASLVTEPDEALGLLG